MNLSTTGLTGSFSGTIIACLLQPLQNIKMALMIPPKDLKLDHNIPRNFARAHRYIMDKEGGRGFFKGAVASALRAGVGSFFYFSSLRTFEKMTETYGDSTTRNFAVSSAARIVSSIFSNPLNVVETRYQLTNFKGYDSIWDAIVKIYKHEGILTFFKGGLTSCFKEGSFAGLYYVFYKEIKDGLGYNKLVAGLVGGLLSTSITHPFEIARAKLQTQGVRDQTVNITLLSEFRHMAQNGGWFKGLTPRLLKKPLSNAFTFLIFETIQEKHIARSNGGSRVGERIM